MPVEIRGLLFIDKPAGPTSHDIVNRIRQLSGIRRIGHTGTLDPLASGLLIICVGRATRLSEYLADLPKSYLTIIRLGQETDTYDAEGEIIREHPVQVTEKQLFEALDQFHGRINQLPPMFSAVKHEGQPLYKYARQGRSVPRSPRTVTIHKIEIENWESPNLELSIDCSSGTFIRSLAHDLGNALQCGGHVASLRRMAIGAHTIDQAVSPDELTNENWTSFLKPAETSVSHLPKVHLSTQDAANIMHGLQVPIHDDHLQGSLVQAYDSDGQFIGVLESEDSNWHGKKVLYDQSKTQGQ